MARPKQQALLFLLGAVLVGGVLGFSADRVLHQPPHSWAERTTMYNDLGLTAAQRASSDSIWDATNCALSRVSAPVYPVLDSIRLDGRQRFRELLTPTQREALDARLRADSTRRTRADSVRRARGDTTRHRSSNLRQDACKR
ncbi:MAG TPA: hypothetical protein VFK16_03185 [Gemmatimonadaceae bacterium]|jgi:hypothetical protein|nr:hypothetical protein [Gemmatimonadaceae bacterium]